MVNTVKIFLDIRFQIIRILLNEVLGTFYSGMGTFVGTGGIRIINENRLVKRRQGSYNGVMDYPIAKRSYGDQPHFGIPDGKIIISTRLVGATSQLLLKLKKFGFQVVEKMHHLGSITTALTGQPKSGQ